MSAMRELCERGAQRVVVTAGKEPALAFDGRSFWRVQAPRIDAVNPIGSGDAFTAGLVWRLLRGEDLGEACRWGSATGAANALTMMAGEVHLNDVERLVRGSERGASQALNAPPQITRPGRSRSKRVSASRLTGPAQGKYLSPAGFFS